MPKDGEKYYYITDVFEVGFSYNNGYFYKKRIMAGNCFKTVEDTKNEIDKIKIK